MLSVLILGPMVAALGVLLGREPRQVKGLALVLSGLTLGWVGLVLSRFDLTQAGMQLPEFLPWLPNLGLNYRLGCDGLTVSLLALNALITWIVIYSTPVDMARPRLYYSLILLVSGGLAGAFTAQNVLLFVLFYELELVPVYFLIGIWGGQKREYAALKFLLYTAVSGLLILAGCLALGWLGGQPNFDYPAVQATVGQLGVGVQMTLLLVLLLGFGIKTPLVPLHTWLPDAYVEAAPPVAILLGGILAKLGTYGLVRFGLQLFPQAWAQLSPALAVWGTVGVLFGALAAIAQKDIKRMVAYSSIGHMGYVMLGCAVGTPLALVGAMAQMVSHGLILAILFHLVGVIERKVGTRELDVLNGLMNPLRGLPAVSSLLVFGGMASAGIPGMAGFVAEFLVFQGSYQIFPLLTLLCVLGTGLTAVYFVILLNRTCFGKLDNRTAYYPAVVWSDKMPALILAGLILFLGVQPDWLVRWNAMTAQSLAVMELAQMPVTENPVIGWQSLNQSPEF
ncbi:NAD(P)H-quinone oxidoreductase subunit D4 [Gloeomargarita lithophora Alchichica-D10]|uniref:NAD(P)H-quinone oxidoreductase subunit D4 n=1 Tax=Gloeomargarita lithophora Alchichica-D10 TaxID=1188229 RepID=A0A1J0AD53_9CYAN|nr:NADH-quinone oxidoreductase subunit M [Gloeomargarita lithophora]APB33839.1 NAD(P)H-quinone oxidoreductase subunit D4 [Gloeomargarita lithophora Alchichica-D10]